MKVTFTDWKVLTEYVWNAELWFHENYRKLSNKDRHKFKRSLEILTADLIDLRRLNIAKKDIDKLRYGKTGEGVK